MTLAADHDKADMATATTQPDPKNETTTRQAVGAVVLIVVAILISAAEQGALIESFYQAGTEGLLQSDALGYYDQALDHQRGFYSAGPREPLFPFLLKVGIAVVGHPQPVSEAEHLKNHRLVRRLTSLLGMVLTVLIASLAWKLRGPWCACLAAWLFSLSYAGSAYATSGLRWTTMASLVVLLCLALVQARADLASRRTWVVTAALCCAAIPLVRLSGLAIIHLLVFSWALLSWLKQPAETRRALVIASIGYLAISWLAVAPFLIACSRAHGNAFSVMHPHATFWRNQEFAGQPGFLSREEVLAEPYGGDPVSPRGYVFGLHSPLEVTLRYLHGYWVSAFRHLPRIFSVGRPGRDGIELTPLPVIWLWIVGVGWCLYRWREYGLLPLAALAAQFPFAFITPLNTVLPGATAPTGVELRFSMPLAPFAAVLAALAVVETLEAILRQRAKTPT